MIALLDANLFVPTWIIDPLLSLAEAGLCEPAWSARVMDEARLAIMEVGSARKVTHFGSWPSMER